MVHWTTDQLTDRPSNRLTLLSQHIALNCNNHLYHGGERTGAAVNHVPLLYLCCVLYLCFKYSKQYSKQGWSPLVAAAYIVVSINRFAVRGEGLIKLLLYHVHILQVILLQGHTGTLNSY